MAPARLGKWPRMRIYMAAAGLTGLFLLIGMRAFALQVEQGDSFRAAAERQHLSSVEIPAPRGRLLDTAGRELAGVADVDSVWADPGAVHDLTSAAEELTAILGGDAREYEARLASRRHFAWIKRHISSDQAQALRDHPIAGVHLAREPRRFYPGQAVAGPLLGFANIDGQGLDGIELTMDDLLAGKRIKRQALRDSTGRLMMADGGEQPTPGATIKLTLDRNIQHIAEQALAEAVAKHKATAGIAVVLDVETSGVLAMANLPTFDPNRPETRGKSRNRALTDAYEIGSVMKAFTISLALDAGVITPQSTFDVTGGYITIGRKRIHDSYRGDTILDVRGVLRRSSNVGTIQIARKLGKDALYNGVMAFGFGKKTGIELPGERSGVIHPTKRWGEIGLASMSYGYMMTATPLQVAAAYAALGNGGVYREPRLVKEVTDDKGKVLYTHNSDGRRVIREETAREILPMLAAVFDKGKKGGTARNVVVNGYAAGGKTGTAHKVDPKTHTYSDDLYMSSFAGLAPIENPRIAVVVVIDEPHGDEHYGGAVAGPPWAQIVSDTLKYLGEPATKPDESTGESSEEAPEENAIPPLAEQDTEPADVPEVAFDPSRQVMVPDFAGQSMAHALRTAAQAGVSVSLEGSGTAISQHPLPGPAERGTECRIIFAQR